MLEQGMRAARTPERAQTWQKPEGVVEGRRRGRRRFFFIGAGREGDVVGGIGSEEDELEEVDPDGAREARVGAAGAAGTKVVWRRGGKML